MDPFNRTQAMVGETLLSIVLSMAKPYGARAGFSDDATTTYVRAKLEHMPTDWLAHSRAVSSREIGEAKAKWCSDNICCQLLNDALGAAS